MPIQVHELTPDDFDALLKFAQSLPRPPQPPLSAQVLNDILCRFPGRSLVATSDKNVVGAILMGASARWGYLLLAPQDDSELRRLLIDKAVMKLASRGGRTCHLSSGAQPLDPFWDSARWDNGPDLSQNSSASARPASAEEATTAPKI